MLSLLLRAAVALLFAAAPGLAAAAGGLSVSPVTLAFPPGGEMQTLEVANPGDTPIDVQVRLFAWTQEDGEDRLAPSDDLGFSPPMFRLAPGAKQTVRLATLRPSGGQERAYRLFVDQLPRQNAAGGVQMPIRMALPLFVAPEGGAASAGAADLTWRVAFDPNAGTARLIARNSGSQRVKLVDLAYLANGGSKPISPGLAGYVLAGSERAWSFDYSGARSALALKVNLGGAAVTAQAMPAAN